MLCTCRRNPDNRFRELERNYLQEKTHTNWQHLQVESLRNGLPPYEDSMYGHFLYQEIVSHLQPDGKNMIWKINDNIRGRNVELLGSTSGRYQLRYTVEVALVSTNYSITNHLHVRTNHLHVSMVEHDGVLSSDMLHYHDSKSSSQRSVMKLEEQPNGTWHGTFLAYAHSSRFKGDQLPAPIYSGVEILNWLVLSFQE